MFTHNYSYFGCDYIRKSAIIADFNDFLTDYYPKAIHVIDRFHVQKLAIDALQEMRKAHHWDAINEKTNVKEQTVLSETKYHPVLFRNGDTTKQLLARSRFCFSTR